MDNYIGQLISKLKTLELDNNTITIFASDNGPHYSGGHDYDFFDSSGGLRGAKSSLYEGGIRSPTLIRWPGHVPAGMVSELIWAFWDVFPTLSDLAGVDSNKLPHYLSGRSILPALLGEAELDEKYLFFTGDASEDSYAIRSGRWKGMVAECTMTPSLSDKMVLYDLIEDPHEENDVASYFPDKVNFLKNLIASEDGISCKCVSANTEKSDQCFIVPDPTQCSSD